MGRALKQLGIKHIAAYSPEARGRSERMFGTLQGRLPKEIELNGITTMEEANRYLQEDYLPRHNVQFTVLPEDTTPAFTPWIGASLDEICCTQEERTVNKDNTVTYESMKLQIPPHPMRHHFIGTKVEVRDYLDHNLALFYGPQCLGRYDRTGQILFSIHKAS